MRDQWIGACSAACALTLPALLIVGAATEQLSKLALWQGALAVLGLFIVIGAVTGAIEGIGLSNMMRAAGRKKADTYRLDQHSIMPRRSASLTGFGR